jgi:hypothetical protein
MTMVANTATSVAFLSRSGGGDGASTIMTMMVAATARGSTSHSRTVAMGSVPER